MHRILACCALLALAACATTPRPQPRPIAKETITIDVSEVTMPAFDLTHDEDTIVFDALGQLWTLPASGGAAQPLTDAVRDAAEDLDPTFSPDGRSVVFRAERAGHTGLWLVDMATHNVRQLTQVAHPDAVDAEPSWSPDGRRIAFMRFARDSAGAWHTGVAILDVADTTARAVRIDGVRPLSLRYPSWTPDGKQIVFVAASPCSMRGGRIWIADANGGTATPLTDDSTNALAPVLSPDGKRVAFLARDSADRLQVWVQDLVGIRNTAPVRLTSRDDVASTRVRWTGNGTALLYAADGKLRIVSADGRSDTDVPFTLHLALERTQRQLPDAQLIAPGSRQVARAYLGLAISPDAKSIAAIALGKLCLIDMSGRARVVADAPFSARGLSWSPDSREVAWSAGPSEEEDLFAADVRTGAIRQLTALPGREALPAYSPDGKYIAFVHDQAGGALRLIDAHADLASDTVHARRLTSANFSWTRAVDTYPQWSPTSDALLLVNDFNPGVPTTATLVHLSGARDTIRKFVDAPVFLQWTRAGTLTWVRHDRLWQASFDGQSVTTTAKPLNDDAALYASAARDGTVLYISGDGLRVRSFDGAVQRIGYPLDYTAVAGPPLLIRGARIVDGTADSASEPRDILIEDGRITRVAAAGSIKTDARSLDATGKFVMPGLIDLHAHTYSPEMLASFLYFGITTVRDQGSSIGPLVAYGDGIAAGAVQGARVTLGGFQFYSDWPFDEEQGRGIEPEADAQHIARSVALAHGFGAQHIKTRTFRRWDINARMIAEAHRNGMRATGHCAAQLPLVAAGMDAKEHIGMCATRGTINIYALNDMRIYDDEIQLYRAAGISVVPTISYLSFAVRVHDDPKMFDNDSVVGVFVPPGSLDWMVRMDSTSYRNEVRAARDARLTTAKLARAGVVIGTGTDIWQVPTGVHMELEELVAAGLTPAQAVRAGTSSAANIIGAGNALGGVTPGKWADLLILDANPLADIRNTRAISSVIQAGRVVDRPAIRRLYTH